MKNSVITIDEVIVKHIMAHTVTGQPRAVEVLRQTGIRLDMSCLELKSTYAALRSDMVDLIARIDAHQGVGPSGIGARLERAARMKAHVDAQFEALLLALYAVTDDDSYQQVREELQEVMEFYR